MIWCRVLPFPVAYVPILIQLMLSETQCMILETKKTDFETDCKFRLKRVAKSFPFH